MIIVAGWVVSLSGCERAEPVDPAPPAPPAPSEGPIEPKTVAYAWSPAAGDPAVPADLGGPGFTGQGWTTHTEITQVGVPDAPQGGTLVTDVPDWPATLRAYGPYTNSSVNYTLRSLVYQTLLDLDPATAEYIPCLATHWWISPDRTTFRFRINPEARWSDGAEVTAADVVATFGLVTDPALGDSAGSQAFAHLERPVALSKYVVEVRAKDDRWTNFHHFATDLFVLPAAQVGASADYLDRFQFAYTAVSGPYQVLPSDVVSGQSLTLTRRRDWWMEENPSMDGWFNFDRIRLEVVKDLGLAFEKVKKGELDYFVVRKAQWWAEELPALDAVRRGLLVPHKFFTENPGGFAGLAINLQRAPLTDVRVRRALQMLFDRETMIDKQLYREYSPLRSFFPGSEYANPENELVRYDEAGAVALLEQAGFTALDGRGYRVKDGEPLAITLMYSTPTAEPFLTLFQSSCKRAGIDVELKLLNPATAMKAAKDKAFDLYFVQWGGMSFPTPETMWHSSLAAVPGNNNITGYANPEVDALIEQYGREYDPARRTDLLRRMDALLMAGFPYVLSWYPPAQRVVFWNKFGAPPWGTPRTGPWAENEALWALWWVDPELDRQLTAAKADPTATMTRRPLETHFWPSRSSR